MSTRSPRNVTPSEASFRRAWASWPGGVRPAAFTTRYHGTEPPCSAMIRPDSAGRAPLEPRRQVLRDRAVRHDPAGRDPLHQIQHRLDILGRILGFPADPTAPNPRRHVGSVSTHAGSEPGPAQRPATMGRVEDQTREQILASARRVVVKVGSSSLTTAVGGLDPARVDALVDALAEHAAADGRELVLVSSGAIAAGLAPLGLKARPRDLATQQAAASVGQGLLMRAYTESFGRHGRTVGQVLLTVDDVIRRTHYRNAYRTLRRLLDLRTIPIVNENDTVATEEIRFGDNDRLAALVAALVHADLLILLSDVDALYTGDPSKVRLAPGRRGPRRRGPRRDRDRPDRDGRESVRAAW